jgi:hypothetical protein
VSNQVAGSHLHRQGAQNLEKAEDAISKAIKIPDRLTVKGWKYYEFSRA